MNTHLSSARTQIARTAVSTPTMWLVTNAASELVGKRILHFGEGKAFQDTQMLAVTAGRDVYGYDPNSPIARHRVLPVDELFDVCVANYVFNTLAPAARTIAFRTMLNLAPAAFVAVRRDAIRGTPLLDGVLTSRGTFQKRYTDELFRNDFGDLADVTFLARTSSFLMYHVNSR